jgi:DNA-binding NarL/FixJ family response regulator
MPISVILVEDEPLWQEAIKTLLELSGNYCLVGVADNYEEALSLFRQHQPQLALLDWKIKGNKDGLALADTLLSEGVAPWQLTMVSGSPKAQFPKNPYGYVPKSSIADHLLSHLDELSLQLSLNQLSV